MRSPAETLHSLCRRGHRQLAVLAGEQAWCREISLRLLDIANPQRAYLISDRTLGLLEPVDAQHVLGGESDLLIVDGWADVDVNALAAVAGTLRSGGLLLLLAEESETGPRFCRDTASRGLFCERFEQQLRGDPSVAIVAQRGRDRLPGRGLFTGGAPRLPTDDQLDAIEAIRHVAFGHRRRPLVLRSDRGRGKSAALGLACGELITEGLTDIVVTGPRFDAVETVFRHAEESLPGCRRNGHRLRFGECELRFVPPDVLLRERPAARLLLVDEAAAIPPGLLAEMLAHYPRLVFATTVHGYEGSGRGFEVRFRRELDRQTPQWKTLWLSTPIRWAEDDLVEAFLNRLLLLDAEPAPSTDDDSPLETRSLDSEALAQDERLLREFFGLLVVAHYQTSPEDLRLLLESPDMRCFAALYRGSVVGAALVVEEGRIEPALADAIEAGERRLRGQLMAQSLAFHCAAPEALQLRGARVSRIAVHHALRRRGIGAALLRFVERQMSALECDYIGASFAADELVTPFWLGEEFSPLRLGTRRDSCSGSHALMVGKPLTPAGIDLMDRLLGRFSRHLPPLLGEQFRLLPPALAAQLLGATLQEDVLAEDEEEVRRYALGIVQYDTCAAALWYYAVSRLAGTARPSKPLLVLVMKVLQHRSWADVARWAGVRGRAGVDELLRLAYRELLAGGGVPAAESAERRKQ